MARYPCALTIAGSDSRGGAGIQADLKTFSALGVYGASVITAVTAQNTRGVRAVYEIPSRVVSEQLDAVLDDLPIATVKIGMLASTPIVLAVAESLRAHKVGNIVLDPVLLSSSGMALLADDAVDSMVAALFPLATLITPNRPEAARLLHLPALIDLPAAGAALLKLGPAAVLIKGGHADTADAMLTDILVTRDGVHEFTHPRLSISYTHGTGCALSSAIAAGLAAGQPLATAVDHAIAWLTGAIAHAWPLGEGQGPVHHFWQWWEGSLVDQT
jgi:hydroxymethylpyrimidine/phosphomethylpyrimidine kinase